MQTGAPSATKRMGQASELGDRRRSRAIRVGQVHFQDPGADEGQGEDWVVTDEVLKYNVTTCPALFMPMNDNYDISLC